MGHARCSLMLRRRRLLKSDGDFSVTPPCCSAKKRKRGLGSGRQWRRSKKEQIRKGSFMIGCSLISVSAHNYPLTFPVFSEYDPDFRIPSVEQLDSMNRTCTWTYMGRRLKRNWRTNCYNTASRADHLTQQGVENLCQIDIRNCSGE